MTSTGCAQGHDWHTFSRAQNDVDAKNDSARRAAMAADGLQLSAFRVSKDELGRWWERHTISMRPPITLVKTIQIQKTRRDSLDCPYLFSFHTLLHPDSTSLPVAVFFNHSLAIS